MMTNVKGILAMAALMGGMIAGDERSELERENDRRFCDLPSCKKEYRHSGRYCCKEHFQEHKKLLKEKK